MSAVPALRPQYQPRFRPAAKPVVSKEPQIRPRLRVVEKPRINFGAVILTRALTFAFLAGTTYMTSALTGQVMVEKARRETIASVERTRAALSVLDPLKARVNKAQDAIEIQNWARNNNFTAPEWASASSPEVKNLVASKTPR